MKAIRRSVFLAVALLVSTSATALAQDVAPAAAGGGGDTGLALEFQGRLSILSDLNIGTTPRFVPPVAVGLRLLEGRLYVGVGLAFDSVRTKACPSGGGTCVSNTDGQLFGVMPMATYDILSRGNAHLYPMLTLTFARLNIGGANDEFAWGSNVGIGVRGDLGDAVSIGSEWGWGFIRSTVSGGGADIHTMGHGFWGTVNVSARIGL